MNIPEMMKNVRELMVEEADELGRSSGFIQRQRKFSGSSYAQMLVFGSIGEPALSYTDMKQYAKLAGTEVSVQGISATLLDDGPGQPLGSGQLAVTPKPVGEGLLGGGGEVVRGR